MSDYIDVMVKEKTTIINQPELINAIVKHLSKNGFDSLLPRQFNKVIECADMIIAELENPERIVMHGMGYRQWLQTDHVGMSSKYMGYILSGCNIGMSPPYYYPVDAGDFFRCIGLLIAEPEFRNRLDLMRKTGKEWDALIENWNDLENIFNSGNFELLKSKMNSIFDAVKNR